MKLSEEGALERPASMSRRKQLRPFKVQDDDDNGNGDKSHGNGINGTNRANSTDGNGVETTPNGNDTDETLHSTPESDRQRFEGMSDENGLKNANTERHITKSSDENRIEIDTNSLLNVNEASKMKGNCQNSANRNGNDDGIQSTENCRKTDSKDNLQPNMAFDALENTKLAVAQFTAAALSKGVSESSIKDLTMLQSALFTLQHQQVFQMQLIEQLQYQLAKTNANKDKKWKHSQTKSSQRNEDDERNDRVAVASELESDFKSSPIHCDENEKSDDPKTEESNEPNRSEEFRQKVEQSNIDEKLHDPEFEPADCKISSQLASNIITNHGTDSPADETNSLQLLQKRAEEVLDSATQSFTTGNLIDELSYRTGAFFNDCQSNDPTLKHRCRFCGKIFGSDSALQIHLRSHTGERPFVCRVCGSRFTTKGNLKVHYQRHTETMEYIDDQAKKDHRPPPAYDLRAHSKVPKTNEHDKSTLDKAFDLTAKATEKDDPISSERVSPLASGSPKRFDEEMARTFLSFDQEYSSSQKKAWEKYMEIVDTPKATELQQDEAYRVDPNKCPICNRILSCRSALRQHYRTHTGERPFQCRLCRRSFTTKGNLKTHIGVHKINPLLSPVHSCTLCHKKYSTAHALQQHINTHTGASIEMTLDQIRAAEVREFVSNESFNELYGSNSSLGDCNEQLTRDSSLDFDLYHKNTEPEPGGNKTGTLIDLSDSEDAKIRKKSSAQDFEKEIEKIQTNSFGGYSPEPKRRCTESAAEKMPKLDAAGRGMDFFTKFPPMFGGTTPLPMSSTPSSSASHLLGNNFNTLLSAGSFNPAAFPSTGVRGNTTCNICFKTLACQSALEIHYRSHTKEKPFICKLCNRGFSTKGNLKQHMLTHKIRDMPQHVFRNSTQSPSSPDSNNSLSAAASAAFQQQMQQQSQLSESHLRSAETVLNLSDSGDRHRSHRQLKALTMTTAMAEKDTNDFDKNVNNRTLTGTDQSNPTYLSSDDSSSMPSPIQSKNCANNFGSRSGGGANNSTHNDNDNDVDDGEDDDDDANGNDNNEVQSRTRSSASIKIPRHEIETPKKRRGSDGESGKKEQEQKIEKPLTNPDHMRSHKQFHCTICDKSFSTKGNLKVHMAAHTWPNTGDANQMPLDLPNHFPQMNPAYGLQPSADLFNPFIANAAVLQQKLHEANLYQKYVNAANIREFTADILKTNDDTALHRHLFGLSHLPFQIFNDHHIDPGSMKNK